MSDAEARPEAPSEGPDDGEHKLILAARVLKTAVYDRDGERIGHIDDLSIERDTGRVRYAILSFGGILGIGERYHPLPWSALHYDPERGGFVVPLDHDALAEAPSYARAELAALGGDRHQVYNDTILEYYGRYGVPTYF